MKQIDLSSQLPRKRGKTKIKPTFTKTGHENPPEPRQKSILSKENKTNERTHRQKQTVRCCRPPSAASSAPPQPLTTQQPRPTSLQRKCLPLLPLGLGPVFVEVGRPSDQPPRPAQRPRFQGKWPATCSRRSSALRPNDAGLHTYVVRLDPRYSPVPLPLRSASVAGTCPRFTAALLDSRSTGRLTQSVVFGVVA